MVDESNRKLLERLEESERVLLQDGGSPDPAAQRRIEKHKDDRELTVKLFVLVRTGVPQESHGLKFTRALSPSSGG